MGVLSRRPGGFAQGGAGSRAGTDETPALHTKGKKVARRPADGLANRKNSFKPKLCGNFGHHSPKMVLATSLPEFNPGSFHTGHIKTGGAGVPSPTLPSRAENLEGHRRGWGEQLRHGERRGARR